MQRKALVDELKALDLAPKRTKLDDKNIDKLMVIMHQGILFLRKKLSPESINTLIKYKFDPIIVQNLPEKDQQSLSQSLDVAEVVSGLKKLADGINELNLSIPEIDMLTIAKDNFRNRQMAAEDRARAQFILDQRKFNSPYREL